jgi:hypothetical protein
MTGWQIVYVRPGPYVQVLNKWDEFAAAVDTAAAATAAAADMPCVLVGAYEC